MRNSTVTSLLTLFTVAAANATPSGGCETSAARKTPHGVVSRIECGNAKLGRHTTVLLDSTPVLSSTDLYKEDGDDNLGYFLFSREANPLTACPDRLFLIDASKRPVKVISFGVRGACNLFESAKWRLDRSVISLKKGVRFRYEHGTLVSPKSSVTLWQAIEPPHTGPGLAQDAALPFVEPVPLPGVQ